VLRQGHRSEALALAVELSCRLHEDLVVLRARLHHHGQSGTSPMTAAEEWTLNDTWSSVRVQAQRVDSVIETLRFLQER
jgi:hypothetical protein